MSDSDFVPSYDTCTEVTAQCSVEATLYGDYFNRAAVTIYAVLFGLLLVYQIWATFRSRAWGFSVWLLVGTSFEFCGYIFRFLLVYNPWNHIPFQMQMSFLILGPTLIAASLAVTFKHIVLYYGPELSLLSPRKYPVVFVGTDVISILVQAAGGPFAGQGGTKAQIGNILLIGGVCFQLVNMIGCGMLMIVYWRRYQTWKQSPKSESNETAFRLIDAPRSEYSRARIFVRALTVAYLLIIVRCIYRIPEMAMGWGSSLMKNEALFLILDGAMILLSVLTICVFHPTQFFPRLGKAKHMHSAIPADVVGSRKWNKACVDSYDMEQQQPLRAGQGGRISP